MNVEDWEKMQALLKTQREEFKEDVKLICKGQIAEAVEKHESGAWSHNPRKALTLAALLVGIIEGIRKFFHG